MHIFEVRGQESCQIRLVMKLVLMLMEMLMPISRLGHGIPTQNTTRNQDLLYSLNELLNLFFSEMLNRRIPNDVVERALRDVMPDIANQELGVAEDFVAGRKLYCGFVEVNPQN